jgi:SRSO17 transposase
MVEKEAAFLDAATAAVRDRGEPELQSVCERIERHFARPEVRARLPRYLTGLLSRVERRNAWQLAEQMGESDPDGVQRLMNGARWDAEAVRDDLRAYVVEQLGDARAVLVVDETGFLKKGTKSVGVQRQYSGTAGRIENCQIGVFLAYASPRGRTFLDRELYLPKEWAQDRGRRAEAGIPEDVEFATKPQLAQRMLERALAAGVPAAWVTADEVYGKDRRLRMWLESQEQAFVLAIASNEPLWVWWDQGPQQVPVATVAARLTQECWERISAGNGAKGPRVYDWAWVPLYRMAEPEWGHWLLVRRSVVKPEEWAYYVVFGPAATPLAEAVQVAGTRWAVEETIETSKGEVGLDQYEVRHWTPWYRYVTLAMLAHAYLCVLRAHALEKGGATSVCSFDHRSGSDGGTPAADRARGAPAAAGVRRHDGGRARPADRLVLLATPSPGASPTVSLPTALGPASH